MIIGIAGGKIKSKNHLLATQLRSLQHQRATVPTMCFMQDQQAIAAHLIKKPGPQRNSRLHDRRPGKHAQNQLTLRLPRENADVRLLAKQTDHGTQQDARQPSPIPARSNGFYIFQQRQH